MSEVKNCIDLNKTSQEKKLRDIFDFFFLYFKSQIKFVKIYSKNKIFEAFSNEYTSVMRCSRMKNDMIILQEYTGK